MAIYKCTWEVEPETTKIKFNEWSERVLHPGSPDLKASALTTGPHCLSLTTVMTHIVVDKRTDNAEQLSICELEHSTSRMFDANNISARRFAHCVNGEFKIYDATATETSQILHI